MSEKKRVLFVCYGNINRSKAAEELYSNDPRYEVLSAGIGLHAAHVITAKDVEWADRKFIMSSDVLLHRRCGKVSEYAKTLDFSSFTDLDIPDRYSIENPKEKEELVEILLKTLSPHLGAPID